MAQLWPKEDAVSREKIPLPGLGKRLFDARQDATKAAGPGNAITAALAGRTVGRSGAAIGRWEAGTDEPSLMNLVGLAKLYGKDPGELAFGNAEERAALVANYVKPEKPTDTLGRDVEAARLHAQARPKKRKPGAG